MIFAIVTTERTGAAGLQRVTASGNFGPEFTGPEILAGLRKQISLSSEWGAPADGPVTFFGMWPDRAAADAEARKMRGDD